MHVFIAILAASIFVGWLLYLKVFRARKTPVDGGNGSIFVDGLSVVFYTRQVGRDTAYQIAAEMRDIVQEYWPKFQVVYSRPDVKYYLAKIFLDMRDHIRDGKLRVVSLYPLSYVLKISINGDDRHSWQFYFVGELHNLFRCFAFGRDRIYPCEEDKEEKAYKKAMEVWCSAFN